MLRFCFGMTLLVVWGLTLAASAQVSAVFADGAVLRVASGTVQLEDGGRILFTQRFTDASNDAAVSVGQSPSGQSVFSILFSGAEQRRVVGIRHGGSLEIIWNESVAFAGDMGEEVAVDVQLQDVDGSGRVKIVKGILYSAARLCGQADSPLLFRESWDFKKKKFVSLFAPRALTAAPSVEADATFVPNRQVALRFLTPQSVSSSVGDDRNPLMLTPPFSLVDDKYETGWSAGEGDGRGEFVSFGTLSSRWKMTAVGIATAASPDRTKTSERFAMPSQVLVAFETGAYQLKLPPDSGMHWFVLPSPVQSSCLSVVLEQSADSSSVPMGLFEVQVQTEIHAPDGLAKVVGLLNDDLQGEDALSMLRTIGKSAFEPFRQQWKTLSPAGRRRGVQFISEVAPVEGAHLLVSFAVTDGSYVMDDVLAGIRRSKGRGERAAGKYLENQSELKWKGAVQLLTRLKTDEAFDVLLAGVTTGSAKRQTAILKALWGLSKNQPVRLSKLLQMAEEAQGKGEWRLFFSLLRICAADPHSAPDAAGMARGVYDSSVFENRYRALRVIATAKTDSFIPFLQQVTSDNNRFLRGMAALALGQFAGNRQALDALLPLASDSEPLVQMEAMTQLVQFSSSTKKDAVLQAVSSDWPQVRALAMRNAVDVPSIRSGLILKGLVDSADMVVQEALLRSVAVNGGEIDKAIATILKKSENADVLATAADVAGQRCQRDEVTVNALFQLLQKGAEPLADPTEKLVGVAAAKALGTIHSPLAVAHLQTARTHSNPTTDKAIDAALVPSSAGCSPK